MPIERTQVAGAVRPAEFGEGEPTAQTAVPRRGPPVSVAVGLLTGLLLLASTQLQLRDLDLFWHLRAGRELLSGVSVGEVGASWSMAPDPHPWVTTQWLSEVLLTGLHDLFGWTGLVLLRTATAALTVAILAWTTLRGRPMLLAAFPYAFAAGAAVSVSQERPNQATLIGAAVLGGVLVRGLIPGALPRWWLLAPLTWVWANLHGSWVLVPFVLAVVSVGRLFDHGLRDRAARRSALLAALAVVCGSLTPAGLASTLGLARFSSAATDHIQEWERTVPLTDLGLVCTGMVLLIGFGWARGRVPWSEVWAVSMLVLFAWAAVRNVAPALLILAPLVASRLADTFPSVGQAPEPRWSAPVGIGLTAVLLAAGLTTLPGRQLLPVDTYPVALAQQIAELPGEQRVLNDYNTAGLVLFFADVEDKVGIDGRTDRYGREYIEDYLSMESLRGDWEALLEELAPTSALLEQGSALAQALVTEKGWTSVAQSGEWVLLVDSPTG